MPTGMLDWPGRMATTVFLAGCNLRCPFCHNPDLIVESYDPTQYGPLMRHVRERRDWIDGVVLTGGEPTCDPALFGLLDELASLCIPVKLDTNGTRPHVLANILESNLVAAVAIDIKSSPGRYSQATGSEDAWPRVEESIHALIGSGVTHEFRTTVCPSIVSLADIATIAQLLVGGDRYVLQQFRPGRTLSTSVARDIPLSPDVLHAAAEECSVHLPTIVRGA